MDIPNEKCNYRTINYRTTKWEKNIYSEPIEHQKNVNPLVPPEDRYGADE